MVIIGQLVKQVDGDVPVEWLYFRIDVTPIPTSTHLDDNREVLPCGAATPIGMHLNDYRMSICGRKLWGVEYFIAIFLLLVLGHFERHRFSILQHKIASLLEHIHLLLQPNDSVYGHSHVRLLVRFVLRDDVPPHGCATAKFSIFARNILIRAGLQVSFDPPSLHHASTFRIGAKNGFLFADVVVHFSDGNVSTFLLTVLAGVLSIRTLPFHVVIYRAFAEAPHSIAVIFAIIRTWHEGVLADSEVFLQTAEATNPVAWSVGTLYAQCIDIILACSVSRISE